MDEWTRDWPTEPNTWHWFYGSDHHMRKGMKRLYAVWVWVQLDPSAITREGVPNGTSGEPNGKLIYSYLGGQLSTRNGASGVWQPIALPDLPGSSPS